MLTEIVEIDAFVPAIVENIAVGAVGYGAKYSYDMLRIWYRYSRFRQIVGSGVKTEDNIIITVPLWRALDRPRHEKRFLKADYMEGREELYGPDEMFNRQDMIGAASVLTVLGNYFENNIGYANDSEHISWAGHSIFCVGAPTSNFHTKLALERGLPKDRGVMFEDLDERVNFGRCCLVDRSSAQRWVSNEHDDYGVVMRLPNFSANAGQHYVFVVAGLHAESTQEAGRMLEKHWKLLGKKSAPNGIVFGMKTKVAGTGFLIKEI